MLNPEQLAEIEYNKLISMIKRIDRNADCKGKTYDELVDLYKKLIKKHNECVDKVRQLLSKLGLSYDILEIESMSIDELYDLIDELERMMQLEENKRLTAFANYMKKRHEEEDQRD